MSRIAMVVYAYYRQDPRVLRAAEALAARGDAVEVFCLRAREDPAVEDVRGVTCRHLGMGRYRGSSTLLYVGSYLAFFLRALVAVGAAHARCPYDLVHTHNMPDFLAFTALVPRLAGRKVLHDVHDAMPELYQGKFRVGPGHPMIRMLRWQERLAARFAHFLLTSEHTKRDALVSRGIPEDRIEVVLNLPDPAIFRRDRPAAPAPDGTEFRLVFHGTLADRLGLDVAIRAVARLRGAVPGLHFDIIGDGDARPALVGLVRELGVGDIVRFSGGYVPVERVPEVLAGADLGVVPTREEISTSLMLPTKLVEYAALGIPAVVAPTLTIRHYFEEDQVAFFSPGSDEDLAEVIRALHADPERRRRLAESSARFFERYRWEDHRLVYLDLVDRLLAS